jgi:hypothetical protein
MGKGGVYGSFVMCKFKEGTSRRFKEDGSEKAPIAGTKSSKSPMVYIKDSIAKYFGFEIMTAKGIAEMRTKLVKTKINGKEANIKTMVSMGATGASRSVTVKFKKLTRIGGKDVASVKVAMPSSHTFGNMVVEIMAKNEVVSNIAAIVSDSGKTMTFGTAYNPKRKAAK